jgi:phosphoenolpyruvate carboxylase
MDSNRIETTAPAESPAQGDKDGPLREDIRLLGRLLGDTVREQQGQAAFDLIESIRRSSIAFHRNDDDGARREFESLLDGLSMDEAMTVVRAFSYFSHLANIAGTCTTSGARGPTRWRARRRARAASPTRWIGRPPQSYPQTSCRASSTRR